MLFLPIYSFLLPIGIFVMAELLTAPPAPAKLDVTMMKEPRAIQGVPRINASNARRKPIPSMLGPMSRLNGLAQSPP